MSDVESTAEHELDSGGDSAVPPSPPEGPPPPPSAQAEAKDEVVTNGKLSLPPVQTTLTDPRLFEIIDWAVTLISSEADLLRTPPWERDLTWLEHARFPGANVREIRLNGERMTMGEPARLVTAMGALSTNFPAAHRRIGGMPIVILGALILVPAAMIHPAGAALGVFIIGAGLALMKWLEGFRTTLDVQSNGFSVNGGKALPIDDLKAVRVQKGTDRIVLFCHNPRREIVIAPRLISEQRDFVRSTLEDEIAKVRQFHAFKKRRVTYDAPDPDRPKLDLDAIRREVSGDEELEEFVEFDGDVVEERVDPTGDTEPADEAEEAEVAAATDATDEPVEQTPEDPEESDEDAEGGLEESSSVDDEWGNIEEELSESEIDDDEDAADEQADEADEDEEQ